MNSGPGFGSTTRVSDLTLTRKRFATMYAIPPCVGAAEIDEIREQAFETMVLRITGYVLGEQLPSHTETVTRSTTFETPASWWQHVKYQHGQRWWLRALVRWRPVRTASETRTLTLTATWENMAAYPWADLAAIPPQSFLGNAVRLSFLTSDARWETT